MRGEGQIAELVAVAEPDVGVIVNVGPVHLELLGTVERVAAAKAELIRDLRPGAACVVPASEPLLDAHLRRRPRHLDLRPRRRRNAAVLRRGPRRDRGAHGDDRARAELQRAAQPAQHARGGGRRAGARTWPVGGRVEVQFSSLRGEVVELPGGVTVVNDCYNANPMSMRAALDHLRGERRRAPHRRARARWPSSARTRRATTARSAPTRGELGIDVLVAVGEDALPYADAFDGETHPVATPEEAGALLEELARPGDRVLIKGSRSVGLERVLGLAHARRDPHRGHGLPAHLHVPGAALHRVPAPEGVRPAHPRGGPGRPPRQGGHAHDGRAGHLPGRLRAVPDPVRVPRRQPLRARHGAGDGRARLRRRPRSSCASGARSGSRAAPSCSCRRSPRSRCGWS